MTTNEPPAPYENVDLSDPIALGKMRYAASRGDRRAKLTLKQRDTGSTGHQADDPPKKTHAGSVAAGKKMYQPRQPRTDDDPAAA